MLPQRTLPNIRGILGQQQHYRISGLSHSHIIWKIKFNILRFVCAVLFCSEKSSVLLSVCSAHTKQASVSQKKIKYKKLCERRTAKVPKTEVQTHTPTHTAKQQKIITIIIKTAEYKQKAAFYEWRAPETDSNRNREGQKGRWRGGKSKLWNSKNRTPQVLASVRIRRCHSHSHSHSRFRCRCRRQSNVSGFYSAARTEQTNKCYV